MNMKAIFELRLKLNLTKKRLLWNESNNNENNNNSLTYSGNSRSLQHNYFGELHTYHKT